MTNQEIYNRVTGLMTELFEIDEGDIKPESRLAEDLDIDSIDAVDLTVELKKLTGKKVTPKQFRGVNTIQDLVDAIAKLLELDDNTITEAKNGSY